MDMITTTQSAIEILHATVIGLANSVTNLESKMNSIMAIVHQQYPQHFPETEMRDVSHGNHGPIGVSPINEHGPRSTRNHNMTGNCIGLASKKPVLQEHVTNLTRKPDVILLQEMLNAPASVPGYQEFFAKVEGRGLSTLVGRQEDDDHR
ncbi:hypothetical protein HPB49_009648 [Dermacentor silvarum]|uniref:Uncharacterized protein n=1 Tax=Dermacentor silvarum TaxID=543639 RepID=A0ACB8C364_DERSI|nr:hypothetical protein HPB49_009648 [Dermacentor silvarum]